MSVVVGQEGVGGLLVVVVGLEEVEGVVVDLVAVALAGLLYGSVSTIIDVAAPFLTHVVDVLGVVLVVVAGVVGAADSSLLVLVLEASSGVRPVAVEVVVVGTCGGVARIASFVLVSVLPFYAHACLARFLWQGQ